MPQNVYNFQINSLSQQQQINFAEFQNKVILIVNVASKCGFTGQYEGLESLYKKYKDLGLIIIGFPCNQFGGQEPGQASEIQENCLVNYGVTFLITEKVEVNGENTSPIFKYLKSSLPGFLGSQDIKWNFSKFLIDRNGIPTKRFSSATEPVAIENDIRALLGLDLAD